MKREFIALLVAAVAVLALRADMSVQDYPDRPVRMIIAFAAGGTIDTHRRAEVGVQAWAAT